MNKKAIILLVLTTVISLLPGCISIPRNYTPSTKLITNSSSNRYDVTYSLSYISDGDESTGRASESRLREIIDQKLKESDYFMSVSYREPSEKSRYHIHFIAHYSMQPVDEAATQGMLIGYTFFIFPSWVNMYLDLSAILIYDNTKIYSTSTSEDLRCYLWLPLLPFGLIWNNWLAWTVQEKNCINYLLNDLTQFQKKHLE